MTILTAHSGEIEIAYQRLGDPAGEPLLLVMGLGAQMVGWPDGLCALLGDRGFDVVRFDNRDVGLSTHLDVATPTGRLRPRPASRCRTWRGMRGRCWTRWAGPPRTWSARRWAA